MDSFIFKLGDEVQYNLGPMFTGHGVICGVSAIPQAGIGHTYILEDKSGNIPNKEYPFTHLVCPENLLKRKH